MNRVLITGATGNVGTEVLNSLHKLNHQLEIYAGARDLEAVKKSFANHKINYVKFDFTDIDTYDLALTRCDILFLLRPPQISDVVKFFKPIIDTCKNKGVKHIIFLSVQGVENNKLIPHFKIEKLILESKLDYTFLRPAYFMQNFTTTLFKDLIKNKRIFLPAGEAKFTLIDVADIGEVTAKILTTISQHINKSYDLTCEEKLTFSEMANILSSNLGIDIEYKSPNLVHFILTKRREKTPILFILVMIMLHYFPRFQKEPEISNWVEKLIYKKPKSFKQFIEANRNVFKV